MNEYNLALEFLTKQDGGSEHKEAVLAYVKALMDESKDRFTKLKEANAKIKRLGEVSGANEEDLEKTLSELQKQVKDLTTERDTLKTSGEANTKELETLRAEKVTREKETKMRSLSEKAGADYDAFTQLFGEMTLELVGETVTVKDGDKSQSLDEYLQSQPPWKKAALFTKSDDQGGNNGNTGKLPAAPASGGQGKGESSAGDKYLSGRYSASRFKKP